MNARLLAAAGRTVRPLHLKDGGRALRNAARILR